LDLLLLGLGLILAENPNPYRREKFLDEIELRDLERTLRGSYRFKGSSFG
jgi:hypothetical protein